MKDLAIFTEQRCWVDRSGISRGRKNLTAIDDLASATDCSLVARVSQPGDGSSLMLTGDATHVALPWPSSIRLAAALAKTLWSTWTVVGRHRSVAVYAPGAVGTIAAVICLMRRRKLIVVAVGNPQESLAPEMFPGARGVALRAVMSASMRNICKRAHVIRYVTAHALQEVYPPSPRALEFSATDTGTLETGTLRNYPSSGCFTLLSVASLDQPYKGIEELIDAVAETRARGWNISLCVAGSGRLQTSLEERARSTLGSHQRFVGHLDIHSLNLLYQDADLFVLPSWTEGMPRALIEAMMSGLPAIATNVGGVPELLDAGHIVEPRRPDSLAAAIQTLLADKSGWSATSERNIMVASGLLSTAEQEAAKFTVAAIQVIETTR